MTKRVGKPGWMESLRRFIAHRGGNVAMMFGLAAIPFFAASGMAIDYTRASQVQNRLADALDATALAVGSQANLSPAQMQAAAQNFFAANFTVPDVQVGQIGITSDSTSVTMQVSATMPTAVMNVVGVTTMNVGSSVTVKRSSTNLEVSLVLDVTGSMAGQKIADLKSAANDLVDIVVQATQSPFFSKVAVVPWSMGVNVGGLATQVRGNVARAGSRAMAGASKASPVVITSNSHALVNGDKVYISGVSGMTALNGNFYTVKNVTTNTFALYDVATGLVPVNGTGYGKWTAGGTVQCAMPGCTTQTFINASAGINTNPISTCVSERLGSNAYTDVAPSISPVGLNYPDPGNPCLTAQIVPMTSNKTAIHAAINATVAAGSTAGQIGVAWGWYMLSPNFGSLFAGEGVPHPYGEDHLQKIAVLMTDGALNSPYCNGVIAKDALTGSGAVASHNSCNATNGSVFNQAKATCQAMKAAGIVVYTVGFDLGGDQLAQDLMSACATDDSHFYLADDGGELRDAFRDIAIKISNLRIAQ